MDMDALVLIGLAVALAMDAFAVAVSVGINVSPLTPRHLFRLGFHFGLFQALMPILGWLAGLTVRRHIEDIDHWIAFALLSFVGGKMILESFKKGDETSAKGDPTRGASLLALSVATSIDALAVGLTLAMLNVSVWVPSIVIGLTAAALTVVGMTLGRKLGALFGKKIETIGGLVLIGIGVKILLEHLG